MKQVSIHNANWEIDRKGQSQRVVLINFKPFDFNTEVYETVSGITKFWLFEFSEM